MHRTPHLAPVLASLLCLGAACSDPMGPDGMSPDGGTDGPDLGMKPEPICLRKANPATFDVDVPTITVSGHITVGGKVPQDSFGAVSLRNTATGDTVALGRTGDAMYLPKQVVPGTYDVYYSWSSSDNSGTIDIPRNTSARLKQGLSLQASGALDLDIPAVQLSGRITVGGKVPQDSFGAVSLRDAATGDIVAMGRTGDMMYTPKLIVPGTYDVYYSWSSSDNSGTIDIPRNTSARVKPGVSVQAAGALDVDVPAVQLSGRVTVGGQVPDDSFGTVTLRAGAGDTLFLGRTGDMMYAPKLVVPGTYDVYYSWSSSDNSATIDIPRNASARLKQGVTVQATGALDVDVPAVQVSGHVTVAGTVPQDSFGTVTLRTGAGDSLLLGRTGDMMYTPKLVVPGAYDIYYSWSSSDNSATIDIPRNGSARLKQGVSVQAAGALDVDVPAVQLSGRLTVDGKVPQDSFGTVTLRTGAGDSLLLGRTGDMMYAPKLVVPGSYELFYSWSSSDNSTTIDIPRNAGARVKQDVTVQAAGALDVDIPVVTLSGRITVDGQVPQDSFGSVRLANQGTGDSLSLGRTADMNYASKLIVPGSFDISYSWSSSDNSATIDIPRNTRAGLGCSILVN